MINVQLVLSYGKIQESRTEIWQVSLGELDSLGQVGCPWLDRRMDVGEELCRSWRSNFSVWSFLTASHGFCLPY